MFATKAPPVDPRLLESFMALGADCAWQCFQREHLPGKEVEPVRQGLLRRVISQAPVIAWLLRESKRVSGVDPYYAVGEHAGRCLMDALLSDPDRSMWPVVRDVVERYVRGA